MEENTKNYQVLQTVQDNNQTIKKRKFLQTLLISLLFFSAISGLLYLGYKNYQLKIQLASQKPQSSQEKELEISPSPTTETTKWKTSQFGSLLYEYPENWHVAELWGNEGEVVIAIDPNPITTAPRGGPLATFEIRVISGLQNPNERLEREKASFNEPYYTDITTETISSDLGLIYHFRGKMAGEILKGQPVETYYLIFNANQNANQNDPINQQIIIATLSLNDDPNISSMLRHIVSGLKKYNYK
jgi:hypothetical protein